MDVRSLPLADRFLDRFEAQGITELYPPQAAAVDAGVAEGESVVAAIPTASGKTMIAQLAMLTANGPALYIVPLRALATEKYEAFSELPGVSVGIATGDYDATAAELADHDIVVATSEKVDAAIRHGADWIDAIACAVIDEVHLLDAGGRGPTLEVTIAKLRRLCDPQLVALSATVDNPDEIAAWLDAAVVYSEWRPVELREAVYDGSLIEFADGDRRALDGDPTPTAALVAETVEDGGGCLVFVRSRQAAQALASDLAVALDGAAAPDPSTAIGDAVEQIEATATTATGRSLAAVVAEGIGFHHAGLRRDHRRTVETAFRDRQIGVLCATPTLAAGVNVPARRVVVRDHERYSDGRFEPLPTLEVQQMFGRAGRPGLDPYGEAIVVADEGNADEIADRYLDASPEAVESALDDPTHLRPHVLATVASGFAADRAQLRDVLSSTFYAHQRGLDALESSVDAAIDALEADGMLDTHDGLEATTLGSLVTRVYVDPRTGADVVSALQRAESQTTVSELTICEIVCDTAEMPSRYVGDDEAGHLSEIAMRRADELAKPIHDFDGDFGAWLPTLKTACILSAYAAGTPVDEIVEQYGIGPGDVRRIAERAEWLLMATESLADHVDSSLTEDIRATCRRLAERGD